MTNTKNCPHCGSVLTEADLVWHSTNDFITSVNYYCPHCKHQVGVSED